MEDTRRCPYCGEEIRAEAIRCRYCRSRLTALDPAAWHRDHPERKLAGVASALARALTVPVTVTRVGFIVLTFFHLLGPVLYGALWLLIPFVPGGESPLERLLARVRELAAQIGTSRRPTFGGAGNGSARRHTRDPESDRAPHLPVSRAV